MKFECGLHLHRSEGAMRDKQLYEVWGDTVDGLHLLGAIAVGGVFSLGAFFLAEYWLAGWGESTQMARAYAMLLGILGALAGGAVSAYLFKPKRHVVEHAADPAWRKQVIEALRDEYGSIGQLADLPTPVRDELRELGLYQLFDEAGFADHPAPHAAAPALNGGPA